MAGSGEHDAAVAADDALQGDVLDTVMSRVPLFHLVPASRVSTSWRRAVRDNVRRRRSAGALPWMLVAEIRSQKRDLASLHAYDPEARTWFVFSTSGEHSAAASGGAQFARGCDGDRLCALSFSKFAIAGDALGVTWRAVKAPELWRQDALLAFVGRYVVALGSGFETAFEEGDVEGIVEILDGARWDVCAPIPEAFGQVAAMAAGSMLSATASERRVYVVGKKTGVASWFEPESRRWLPARSLHPGGAATAAADWGVIAAAQGGDEKLVVFGLRKDAEPGEAAVVRLCVVDGETLATVVREEEVMPPELAGRLFPSAGSRRWSMEVRGSGEGGYLYNTEQVENGAAMFLLAPPALAPAPGGGGRRSGKVVARWEWVPHPEALRWVSADRIIVGCSTVGFDELAATAGATNSHC